jgi:hypothetical protein
MAYFHELSDNFFGGLPTVCLGHEESTLAEHRNPLAHKLLQTIEKNDCFILAEGSKESTAMALRTFLANIYLTSAVDRTLITFHSEDEIVRICDSVKYAVMVAIIQAMQSCDYNLVPFNEATISICAYHYGFNCEFTPA